MKQIKTISIKCETEATLELAEMTEMQGGLKERTDIDCDKIKLSICKYGFSFPFFIWKSGNKNYLLDGHGRFATLCKMQKDGYIIPELPVVYVSCKNKAEAKQKLLRLNSTFGHLTKESVLEFAEDIDLNFEEIALPDTVIDFSEAEEPTEETKGDDDIPEVEEKVISKDGEMYELGNSILFCCNSLDSENVKRLLGDKKIELTFTDPPYQLVTVGGGIFKENNAMKEIKNNKVDNFNPAEITIYSDTNIYFHNRPLIKKYIELAETNKLPYDLAFYKKVNTAPNYKGHLMTDVEYIAIIGKQDPNKGLEKELYSKAFTGQKDADNALSYSKPVALCEKYIKLYSKGTVLDLFGGSGSTLIAAEKLNVKCFMLEHNPQMCDVIRRRYTKWCLANNKPLTSGCLQ